MRRLGGGLAAITHAFRTSDGARFVVKRDQRPDHAFGGAVEEHACLKLFSTLRPVVPDPVALDAAGEWFGMPAVVMTRLPGGTLLRPRDLGPWCRQMAETMAVIHAIPIPEPAPEVLSRARKDPTASGPWTRLDQLPDKPPERVLAPMRRALTEAQPTDTRRVLTHHDFHPGNLLWSRGRLSGVIDWAAARIDCRAAEVAYCRVDVALLHGVEAADLVADHYRSLTADALDDLALWDLRHAIRGLAWYIHWLGAYEQQGLRGFSARQAGENLLAFAQSALQRLP